MSIGPPPSAAPAWKIRAVAIRTRDGPDRLDQVYRLLVNSSAPDRSQAEPSNPLDAPVSDCALDSRR